jgi:hypothetical protein
MAFHYPHLGSQCAPRRRSPREGADQLHREPPCWAKLGRCYRPPFAVSKRRIGTNCVPNPSYAHVPAGGTKQNTTPPAMQAIGRPSGLSRFSTSSGRTGSQIPPTLICQPSLTCCASTGRQSETEQHELPVLGIIKERYQRPSGERGSAFEGGSAIATPDKNSSAALARSWLKPMVAITGRENQELLHVIAMYDRVYRPIPMRTQRRGAPMGAALDLLLCSFSGRSRSRSHRSMRKCRRWTDA